MINVNVYDEESIDNDNKMESLYLSRLFENVNKECNNFFQDIINTEEEYLKLSFFTKKKSIKNFERNTKITFSDAKEIILKIQKLWKSIEEILINKSYHKINNYLRTYGYEYLPIVQNFIYLEKYYEEVPDIFMKSLKEKFRFQQLEKNYIQRKETIERLTNELNKLYTTLVVD